MKAILTPREFAEAIGVSESSVKRWVDSGEIEAMRTAGGHRRISMQEAARYLRERSIPLVRPDILGLSEETSSAEGGDEVAESATRFFEFLRRGAGPEAQSLLLALYLKGLSIAEIVDGPFRGAMERFGILWKHEPAGLFLEHRATQIALQSLSRLRSLVTVAPDAPVAVGGAPTGDRYILASMAVAAVLEGEGIRAVNLGPETPIETLKLGIEEQNARLAWLSVSALDSAAGLRDEILALLPFLKERGTPLVVGGSQAKKLRLAKSEALFVASSMTELEALAKGIRMAPAAPAVAG